MACFLAAGQEVAIYLDIFVIILTVIEYTALFYEVLNKSAYYRKTNITRSYQSYFIEYEMYSNRVDKKGNDCST